MSKPKQGILIRSAVISTAPIALAFTGILATTTLLGGCATPMQTEQATPEEQATPAQVKTEDTEETDGHEVTAGTGTEQDEDGIVVAKAASEDPTVIVDDNMFRIEMVDRHVRDKNTTSVTYAKLRVTNKTDRILGIRCLDDWTRGDNQHSNPLIDDPTIHRTVFVEIDTESIWAYDPGETKDLWLITNLGNLNLPETGYIGMEGSLEAYEGIGTPEEYETAYMQEWEQSHEDLRDMEDRVRNARPWRSTYVFEGDAEQVPARTYRLSF